MKRALVVIAALLPLSACSEGPARTSSRSDSYRDVSALVVDHRIGSVSIVHGNAVTVARTLRMSTGKSPTERTTEDGTTLHVGATCPASFNADVCSADYRITVPAAVAVTVEAGANAVTVDGISAQVDVTTDSGPLTLRGVAAVRAVTESGRVSIQQSAPGRLDVRSDSGSMAIGLRPGSPLTATASSGDIRITTPAAGGSFQVVARATSGRVSVHARQSASGTPMRLTTDSGDITVT